jgi:hypothetical protein
LGTIDGAGVSNHKPSGSRISALLPQTYFVLESNPLFTIPFQARGKSWEGNLYIGTMSGFRTHCNLLFWAFNETPMSFILIHYER